MRTNNGNVGFWDWRSGEAENVSAFFLQRSCQVKLAHNQLTSEQGGRFDARSPGLFFLHLEEPEKELADWCNASPKGSILLIMSTEPDSIGPIRSAGEDLVVRRMRFPADGLAEYDLRGVVRLTPEGELVERLINKWLSRAPMADLAAVLREIAMAAVADELLAAYILALGVHANAIDLLRASQSLDQTNWLTALQQFRERTPRGSEWRREFAPEGAEWPDAIFGTNISTDRIPVVGLALGSALGVERGGRR